MSVATDYDSPWKEILEGYFPAFMAFFFPQAHGEIDWSQAYKFLSDPAAGVRGSVQGGHHGI